MFWIFFRNHSDKTDIHMYLQTEKSYNVTYVYCSIHHVHNFIDIDKALIFIDNLNVLSFRDKISS